MTVQQPLAPRRVIPAVVAALIASLAVSGSVPAAPAEKAVVLVRTGVEADSIRAVAQAYTAKTGRPVEIMEAGRRGFYPAVYTQLLGGATTFDLAQLNDVDVGPLAEAGVIAPIDRFLFDRNMTNPVEYDLWDFPFIYRYGGRVYAVPFDISTMFLYYRSDLISRPPQTWDEYLETAKRWTKSRNPASPTLYGASLTALAGSEQPKTFYTVMWSKGGWIINDKCQVGVDSPGALAAADFYVKLRVEKVVPPDLSSWGFSEVYDALRVGAVAMAAPYWNAAYPMLKASDSPIKDKIRITLVPGERQPNGSILRTPFQQGKVLLLNAHSPRKEAAWRFYAYLTGKEGTRIMARAGGTPSRMSAFKDPTLQPREYYEMMLASLRIAKGDRGFPFYAEQHEAMNSALSSIVTGTEEPRVALERAARVIRDLIRRYGFERCQ